MRTDISTVTAPSATLDRFSIVAAPTQNLEVVGQLWALAEVSGYPTSTPGATVYSCSDARSSFGVEHSLGMNPAQNYWRAVEVIGVAKNALNHGPTDLTIVATEATDIRFAESREVRNWVENAFAAAREGQTVKPLILANDSGMDRSWTYYYSADLYPEHHGVILRSGHPTIELGVVDASQGPAADGMMYDERGIFPRFKTSEEKDVWVARTRVAPEKQVLSQADVAELDRLLDKWVPPSEAARAFSFLERALTTFALDAGSVELLAGTALNCARNSAQYAAKSPNNHDAAAYAGDFFKVAVDAFAAAANPVELRQQRQQALDLSGDIREILLNAKYTHEADLFGQQCARLQHLPEK